MSESQPYRYRIRHLTRYVYGGEVVHSHQLLRLKPRPMPHQTTISHQVNVSPQPAVSIDGEDAFGNPVTVSDDSLKRYAAVEAVYEKALTTLQSTETEAQQNNQEIADTYQQMTQAGITQQEYEKLRGKIQTLSVRQQALQAQRQDALSMIQAEQTINQNQKTKEDAVTGQAQESAQEAVVNGVSQTQFDVLSWQ